MKVEELFTDSVKAEVELAIYEAEKDTSGEIRLFVENHNKRGDLMDRAAFLFNKLEMHKTELRNGVLFYMAVKDQQFVILGDGGINAKVPDDFWHHIKNHMTTRFEEGEVPSGLMEGIRMAGKALAEHFPIQNDDQNELSNEVLVG
jgi:uncharacterized membrane protein